MLEDHLPSDVTRKRLHAGPFAERADAFADWLHEQGYAASRLTALLRCLAAWSDWMRRAGISVSDAVKGLAAYEATLGSSPHVPRNRRPKYRVIVAASLFIRFLQETSVLPRPMIVASPLETWPILVQFRSWLQQHRGAQPRTLDAYQEIVIDLLVALGDQPRTYTASSVRDFVLQRARPHGHWHAKGIATAVRAFLRFLGVTGQCSVSLIHAVPQFSSPNLSSTPRYLEPADVERVLDACTADDILGLRDRAVMLLLARLALRASDVALLTLRDIDWKSGQIGVQGKGRRREWLPLPQEVGDAVLRYIREARPKIASDRVFVKVWAPLAPLSRASVTHIARSALRRAGVSAPINGAHVFRHSAATAMLRQGTSLAGVGAVLRHRRPSTTAIYAKVDFDLLREIAQPWPEVTSC